MESRISYSLCVPSRQGMHLPQDSEVMKASEVARHVHHAGVLVHDDQAAGSHDRAHRLQRLVVDLDVQVLGRDAPARRPADLHGLERLAAGDAAADVEDDLAQRDAHGHLDEARRWRPCPVRAKTLVPLEFCVPMAEKLSAPSRMMWDDVRHGLHVVDDGRLLEKARDRRERRPRAAACRAGPPRKP